MKKMRYITTHKAPIPVGPYSQGVTYGDFVFVSGQIPLNPETGEIVKGGIEEQTEQVIKNISEILKEGGSCLENTVKVTIFLKNMKDFEGMNKVYSRYFINKPARSTVEVSNLPKGVLIEMDCIGFITEMETHKRE